MAERTMNEMNGHHPAGTNSVNGNGTSGHNLAEAHNIHGNRGGEPKNSNGNGVNAHTSNGLSSNGNELEPSSVIPSNINASSSSAEAPIAICGMAVRLPGGVATPQQFWDFLVNKGDGRRRVPENRYNVSNYYSPSKKPGSIITEYGYFLDESMDLGALDTSFFTMTRSEVERTDPQQRMMLEVARECLEDAGVTNWRGKTIGCYIGNFGEDWLEMFAKEPQQWGMHRAGGYGDYIISNRVSYEMDLRGPSMTIRTACSSALIALNEACMAIQRGDCEAALVGGSNLILAPGMTNVMTEQGVLSPDGSCKSFSADANGYARGEAIAAIFVKPLSHAVRDGDPVRAVIRATAVNVDGKTPGMSAPSTDAHETMIRRAYKVAGINDFSQTAVVECHGTGTPVGDPIEANAVARVFGESGVYIGSVKPNVGHSEGASGLVSVIKSVLALEHRTIAPNIRFTSPNPAIPFESAKLKVPLEPTPWPQSRHERVSVNSFGIGGANAHVILDSAASFGASAKTPTYPTTPQLLLFSANSAKSLAKMTARFQEVVEKYPEQVGDLAYTLGNRREHLSQRTFAICNEGGLGAFAPAVKVQSPASLVMVFTGQGAQWPQMGRDLLKTNVTFRESIRSLDRYLQSMGEQEMPIYSIEEELLKPAKRSRLSTAELSQPLCTAVQIALVDTLKAFSIAPHAVVGHSSGEIAAAYAARALTAEEAIITAHYRGAVASKQTRIGAMAAIGMSWTDAEKYLIPKVTIACDNSPSSVTISGDTEQVKTVTAQVSKLHPDVMARLLQVDKAYHSYHMAEVGDDYRSLIDPKVDAKPPTIPFFSSVSGSLLTEEEILGARYWQTNLESPVRFREAITNLLKHEVGKNAVFLEIGPHSALAGPLRQIFTKVTSSSSSVTYVSTMLRNQNSIESLLTAVGKLHSLNVPIDLKAVIPHGSCLPDLPRYPWDHDESYWYESRVSREWRLRKHAYHDLLGVRVAESSDIEPVWRNLLHLQNVPWIRDHKVGGDIIYPFAGYIALAGEAIRQLSGVEGGFSIQSMIVSTALVLPEGKPTEIITALRPRRLTTSLNSQWWEFTVTSHNGYTWNKHCTGEVSPLSSDLGPAKEPEDVLPRKVGPRKWYETMRRAGLDLGPAFQNLETVVTSTGSGNKATGKVSNSRHGDEANYHIHPTVVDATLQLLGAAFVNGYSRKYKNWLPTIIEKAHVTRCLSDMVSTVSAKATGSSSVVGEGRCTSRGKIVLEVSGVRISLAEGSLPTSADDYAAGRKEWGPDVDFMDLNALIALPMDHTPHLPLLNELSQLCVLCSSQAIKGLEPSSDHIRKYTDWIASQAQSLELSAIGILDNDTMSAKIQDLVLRLSNTPVSAAAKALYQICTKSNLLTSGAPLEEILSNNTIKDIYDFIDKCDRSLFIQNLAHFKPNLKVLEIGCGRGSSGSDIAKHLTLDTDRICCSKYTLTTTAFVIEKDQQKIFDAMEYATLDISKDLAHQNFADRQYDLIMIANGLHACKNVLASLKNIRSLLHPDGWLLLQETYPSCTWIKYIFGASPGFWIGDADGRSNEPYLSAELWRLQLSAAGFGLPVAQVENQLTAVMVTRPLHVEKASNRITVLCPEVLGDSANRLLDGLRKVGYELDTIQIEDQLAAGQDVISILDLDGPFFHEISATRFQAFKDFLSRLGDSGVMWITKMCQIGCKDPRYGQALGLIRNIRSEKQIHFATCEVDDFLTSSDEIVKVFNKFHSRKDNDKLKPDFEYCIRNGQINIGRVYPVAMRDELLISELTDKAVLDVGTPGRLNTLHWSRQAVPELQTDQVEIEVYAVGLNFRDVLIAMGVIELPERVFGLESSGVVLRVGPDVKDLQVGDRVACIENRAFSTSIITTQSFCSKIPDSLNFVEAATLVIPYTTVIHSLMTVGGLAKDQSVLIHSACGGVGLAAIQVSRMMGADIYVTVGSEEKVKFLMETFSISRNRIFNSRDTSFVDGIMRETKGKGVDVVLNSLSGELLHATWTCVAEYGKMIEIGKRDLVGSAKLDMNIFLANRTYSCVDIDGFRKVPGFLKKLLDTALEYIQNGDVSPIRPIRVFNAASTADAFLAMSKGLHIGRIAVSIREAPGELDLITERRPIIPTFKGSASYLLIGGLGGLGRAISTWMVDNGARELVYLSRNAGAGPDDQTFVKEMHSMGCDIKLVRGNVTELGDVKRAIQDARFPLKGIIQMAMAVYDRNFTVMTYEEWMGSVRPKVRGTWNLHNATLSAGINLDFFVLFSSLSGIFGQPGQANYASANTFLDAFSQYRNGLGLAASVIDLGSVADVGFFEKNQELLELLRMVGFKGVPEQHMLDAMTAAVRPHLAKNADFKNSRFVAKDALLLGIGAAMSLSNPNNRAIWRDHRPMAIYHNETGESDNSANASNESLKSYLATIKDDISILKTPEAANVFAVEIGKKLFDLLLKPEEEIDINLPLINLGFDSIVALELRSWWKQVFSFDISVLEMMGIGSLLALGEHAAEGLLRSSAEKNGENGSE